LLHAHCTARANRYFRGNTALSALGHPCKQNWCHMLTATRRSSSSGEFSTAQRVCQHLVEARTVARYDYAPARERYTAR
jgi:hypothetical protein